jgi:hypothetical protein
MSRLQVIAYTVVYAAAIVVGLLDLLVWRP